MKFRQKRWMSLSDAQLNILIILSDKKGHALWELTERMHQRDPGDFLRTYLRGLTDEKDSWEFLSVRISDITNPTGLANKLHEAKDPPSRYILEQLPEGLKSFFKNFDAQSTTLDHKSKELYQLASSLDQLIKSEHFDRTRFEQVQQTDELKNPIEQGHTSGNYLRQNRRLLEASYPNEIAKSKKAIIEKGLPRDTTNLKSQRPKQQETPYHINKDLKIFALIIRELDSRRRLARLDLNTIQGLHNAEKYRLMADSAPSEIDKDLEENMEYNGKKISFYEENYKTCEERLKNFMLSPYTGDLIKIFGFSYITSFLSYNNFGYLDDEEDTYFMLDIAASARDKGLIGLDEYQQYVTPLEHQYELKMLVKKLYLKISIGSKKLNIENIDITKLESNRQYMKDLDLYLENIKR